MHVVALVFAVAVGLLILAGYFIPALAGLQSLLLQWAIIVGGVATLVGIANLVMVHGTRIRRGEKGGAYSAVLLFFLFAAFVLGLALGPHHPVMRQVVNAVVVPAEASLMAVLAVSLLYSSIRLVRRRGNLMTTVFLLTAIVMLFASATLPFGEAAGLSSILRPWIQHVLALGGARGMLMGVALGTLLTGLRVLTGADRPYEGG